jgi:hypothetical protein
LLQVERGWVGWVFNWNKTSSSTVTFHKNGKRHYPCLLENYSRACSVCQQSHEVLIDIILHIIFLKLGVCLCKTVASKRKDSGKVVAGLEMGSNPGKVRDGL